MGGSGRVFDELLKDPVVGACEEEALGGTGARRCEPLVQDGAEAEGRCVLLVRVGVDG